MRPITVSMIDPSVKEFLVPYPPSVAEICLLLTNLIRKKLPSILTMVDLPAKMIAFAYGNKYSDMICAVIPSQKGAKLSFYRGPDLEDPGRVLEGNATTTRYVGFKKAGDIDPVVIENFLEQAYILFLERRK